MEIRLRTLRSAGEIAICRDRGGLTDTRDYSSIGSFALAKGDTPDSSRLSTVRLRVRRAAIKHSVEGFPYRSGGARSFWKQIR